MAQPNVVDRLYIEFSDLQEFLDEKGGFTFRSVIEENFPKTMLLAAASYFEYLLSNEIVLLAKDATAENHVLVSLIRNKAISRQYHSWFNWGDKEKPGKNANQFFGMFGDGFKNQAIQRVRGDEDLNQSVVDFIEIGWERNRLVHQNFADYRSEKTASEVYNLYKSAVGFVNWFPRAIRDYSEGLATVASSP